MKFGKVGQIGLVVVIALLISTLFTACGTLTVGFLFVATTLQSPGQIEVYEVNSESGLLRHIPTSPFPSGGRNPVAEVASPNALNLYVVNEDDANIVQFGIGTDGKLYPQSTINTPGTFPIALAINAAGTYVYSLDTLSPVAGCSLGNPCPGDLAAFPVSSTGSLGAGVTNSNTYPNYYPLLLNPADTKTVLTPTAVTVLPGNKYVYASAWNQITSQGYLFGFAVNTDGTLAPLNSGLPYQIGSEPNALATDTTGNYLFVSDMKTNTVTTFSVASGTPTKMSTVATGNQPSGIAVDGSSFVYVTNSGDGTVNSYALNNGTLTFISTKGAGVDPVAVTVDPRHVGYLYTVNFLSNSLNGYAINKDGTLINTQNSPYISSEQPTAIAGIPHNGTVQR